MNNIHFNFMRASKDMVSAVSLLKLEYFTIHEQQFTDRHATLEISKMFYFYCKILSHCIRVHVYMFRPSFFHKTGSSKYLGTL